MPRPPPTPARWPALLFVAVAGLLLLQGCSVLVPRTSDTSAPRTAGDSSSTPATTAFTLEVTAPEPVRALLLQHLELQRFRTLQDLHDDELQRLLDGTEPNVRALLGTLGHFDPEIRLEWQRNAQGAKAPTTIRLHVAPGPQTRVRSTTLRVQGPVQSTPGERSPADTIEQRVRALWSLPIGSPFTQQAWERAKAESLRVLQARRYPLARIQASRADIDAESHLADLSMTYDTGPALTFGPLRIEGSQRYSADGARRIAQLPTGRIYDESEMLDAQQRLARSGYYDAVFLTLDSETSPDTSLQPSTVAPGSVAAPVIAQVREAPLQKLVFGAGFSTDSGARLSLDHTHNQFPSASWRALSKLSLDKTLQQASTDWTALPDDNGWRWFSSASLQRQQTGDFDVNALGLSGGRTQSTRDIDRSYFVRYENTRSQGLNAPADNAALSMNYGFTRRRFNSDVTPTKGYGLAVELGAGTTLQPVRTPFLRTLVRWQSFTPLRTAKSAASSTTAPRLAIRAQAGAVAARNSAQLPATQLFLTGGDTTVRGYGLRTIGSRTRSNQTYGGRYLATGSMEWQSPIVRQGKPSDWESAVFIDAGAVADKVEDLRAKVGVGAGVRWRSPVGPLQADLAYGVQLQQWRLHLRLGFSF